MNNLGRSSMKVGMGTIVFFIQIIFTQTKTLVILKIHTDPLYFEFLRSSLDNSYPNEMLQGYVHHTEGALPMCLALD